MKKISLPVQILIALVLAVAYGHFFPSYIGYIGWMGTLFMNALKMLIVPLILTSIVTGVSNLGQTKNIGRLGMKTMSYYILTSTFAIVTGLLYVNAIKPGVGIDTSNNDYTNKFSGETSTIYETLLNIIPNNIFEVFTSNKHVLSLIFIAIIFGVFINKTSTKNKTLLTDLFKAGFDLIMRITMFIIKFTPYGVFAIVAKVISENDLMVIAQSMGWFMLTVLLALFTHAFITLPIIVKIFGKSNAFKFFKKMSSPLLTAFSTSSSNATLPLTLETINKEVGVSNKVSSFTLPLGATVNMDGTALYECISVIFIAQAYGIPLDFMTQITIVVIALLTSIGAAGIPMAGLFMITVILSQLGLPLDGVGLILAVDRVLDMFRTATNVWSDSCGALVIAKSEGEIIDEL